MDLKLAKNGHRLLLHSSDYIQNSDWTIRHQKKIAEACKWAALKHLTYEVVQAILAFSTSMRPIQPWIFATSHLQKPSNHNFYREKFHDTTDFCSHDLLHHNPNHRTISPIGVKAEVISFLFFFLYACNLYTTNTSSIQKIWRITSLNTKPPTLV